MEWKKHGINRLANTKPPKTKNDSEASLGQDKSKLSASLRRNNSFRTKLSKKAEPCERSRQKSEKHARERDENEKIAPR